MPRARFYNLAPAARARLLRIATRHFARRGIERASLNEILAEAKVSKGAYYYYFDDKDDLLATVLDDAVETMLARIPPPDFERVAADEFWPTVERWIDGWRTGLDISSDVFGVAAQFTGSRRSSERFEPILFKARALYRRFIEPGQRLGCVRTDLPVDVLVRLLEANDAVLDGIFLASRADVMQERVDRHVKLVFGTFKRLLVAEPPRDAR
ncbi:MAG: TetR/AcrR family transcriptional regulator [Gemmatimonadales bacterium]|jgi:AcrR family transcriptional regulator